MRTIAPNVTPASDSAFASITMRRREVTSVEDAPAAVGAVPEMESITACAASTSAWAFVSAASRIAVDAPVAAIESATA